MSVQPLAGFTNTYAAPAGLPLTCAPSAPTTIVSPSTATALPNASLGCWPRELSSALWMEVSWPLSDAVALKDPAAPSSRTRIETYFFTTNSPLQQTLAPRPADNLPTGKPFLLLIPARAAAIAPKEPRRENGLTYI